jgi:hypothetical protein
VVLHMHISGAAMCSRSPGFWTAIRAASAAVSSRPARL